MEELWPPGEPSPMESAWKWAWAKTRQYFGRFAVGTLGIGVVSSVVSQFLPTSEHQTIGDRLANGALVLFGSALIVGIVALAILLFVAPYRQRKLLRRAVNTLTSNIGELTKPQLRLVFDPRPTRPKPYIEDSLIEKGTGRLRKFRVGIANLGSETIPNVKVVLKECEPDSDNVWLFNPLHFMETDDVAVDIRPSPMPSVFVDVIWAVFALSPNDKTPTAVSELQLAYQPVQLKQPKQRRLPTKDHRIVISAEGDHTFAASQEFVLRVSPTDVVMEPTSSPT